MCRPSGSRICDCPIHLQGSHLHVWDLVILRTSRWAVTGRSSHWTEASSGAACVGETRRSRQGRTPQEPTRCHQVPIALCVREGVARTAGAGATDAGTSSWWSRCCFRLPHFEHNLTFGEEMRQL